MSAPEFERVLYVHREGALTCYDHPPTPDEPWWCCACGEHQIRTSHRAHLAAALNAEVARWLADEGTRERVAREMFRHACNVSNLPRWMQAGALGRDLRPLVDPLATAALAALTPTDTTADEGGAR